MNRAIAAIPVDARPVVRSQVQDLVACAGWDLRMPPPEILGCLRQAGDRDALNDWIWEQAPEVDGFVLSLDMMVYGGLIPSRFVDEESTTLLSRLSTLQRLREKFPVKPIFAFAATMRISNNDIAEEEKAYWAEYGSLLWAWSFHQDRATHGREPKAAAHSAALIQGLERNIPEAIRTDYVATRRRNFEVTRRALHLVQDGVITRLVLPQDDTAEYGLNVAERRQLQFEVQDRGVDRQVAIYAGADEVMHTLCARLVSELEKRPALRVVLMPSDPVGLPNLRARYEDRALVQSIAAQLAAVHADEVRTFHEADVVLAIHTQGTAQGDWAMGLELPDRPGVTAQWLEALHHTRNRPQALALADLAYANGGDPWLFNQALPLPDAYAGWNTASNTLGSVLAQCVLGHGRLQEAPSRKALSLRLQEDLLYQAELRQILRAGFDEATCSCEQLLQAARALVLPAARVFAERLGLSHVATDLKLPWNRSFEVDLHLEPLR